MNMNQFAEAVALNEKGKKEVDIAQIKQILKIVNKLVNGSLYKIVELIEG